MGVAIAWACLGYVFAWFSTGRTDPQFTYPGVAVLIGPLLIVMAVYWVGDVGPLRAFWGDATTLAIDARGLTASVGSAPSTTIPWEEVGGISAPAPGVGLQTVVYDRAGTKLATYEGIFARRRYGFAVDVGWEVARLKPAEFERVGNRWSSPFRGCVRRDLPPLTPTFERLFRGS